MRTAAVAMLGACAILASCTNKNLIFTTYTKVGVDISAADGTPTSAVFGYKRFEGAVIPVDVEKATGKPEDAMSVFAGLDISNGWLDGLEILQVFATGDAAVKAAEDPETFGRFIEDAKKAK